MPILIPNLSDLLHPEISETYWYVKRKHQNEWFYLKEFNEDHTRVVWTKNKIFAIPYAHENTAKRFISKLKSSGAIIETVKEILE